MSDHLSTQRAEDGLFRCSVCGWTWKRYPAGWYGDIPLGGCPGLPRFRRREQPEHLVTQSELRRRGLRRADGQPALPRSWWLKGAQWVYYWGDYR